MLPNDILTLFSHEARAKLMAHEKDRGSFEEIRVRLMEPVECINRDGFLSLITLWMRRGSVSFEMSYFNPLVTVLPANYRSALSRYQEDTG